MKEPGLESLGSSLDGRHRDSKSSIFDKVLTFQVVVRSMEKSKMGAGEHRTRRVPLSSG